MDQSQEHQESQEYGIHRCSFHPDVETGLACGRCGRYICPRCMVQTPVGSRCPDCARVTRHPTFDVQPSYYLRASSAGGVVGIIGGVIWGLVLGVPFLPWLVAIGVGYFVGEAVSLASNRKRGTGLAVTAGASVALAVIVAMILVGWTIVTSIFFLLSVALAIYIAVSRVR